MHSVGGCASNDDCTIDKACVNGQCRDPCSMRAACGENALCTVIHHRPSCKCPECFIGRAHVRCRPREECLKPPPRPREEECNSDNDCAPTLACRDHQCADPCANHRCESPHQKCVVQSHKPKCACKYKLVVNAALELSCPGPRETCFDDEDCPANLACLASALGAGYGATCANPCANTLCPKGKVCQVLNHEPLCMCSKDCEAEVSVCLRDRGCPLDKSCVNLQCVDPCEGLSCPNNTPCVVEEHKAICKFCPPGFVVDQNYGCLQAGTLG